MSKAFIVRGALMFLLLQTGIAAYASPDQLNDDDTTVSSACANIPVRVQYGSKDTATTNHVMMLQDFLYENNYLTLQPTGFFGAGTYKAVKAFQKANGIAQTGSVGPATRAKIKTISCLGGVAQGDTQIVATNTLSPASVASKTVCSGVRPVAGVNGVASVRDYSGNTWGGGDTTKPSTVWHFGTDSSCSYQCMTGMVQDDKGGCRKNVVALTQTTQTNYVVITCSGSRPTAGVGGVTTGIGYSATSVGGGGNYQARTDWHYGTDSCSWSCDFPMTHDGAMGCKNPPAGTGIRVNVSKTDGGSVTGIVITPMQGIASQYSYYPAVTTNPNGAAHEFWFNEQFPSDYKVFSLSGAAMNNYKIKSATGCSATTFITGSQTQTNNCSGAVNGTTVEIVLMPGDISTAPVTDCTTDQSTHKTLSCEITKGDPSNTWGCIDNPNTQPGYECAGAREDVWRKLGGQGDLWQINDAGTKVILNGMSVDGYPAGNYALYTRVGNQTKQYPSGRIGNVVRFEMSSAGITFKSVAASLVNSKLISMAGVSRVLGEYASNASCVDLSTNLFRGKEGESVIKLQNFLEMKGLLIEKDRGFYGDNTISAVKDYQMSKDLPVTGMVYETTRLAIKLDSCK